MWLVLRRRLLISWVLNSQGLLGSPVKNLRVTQPLIRALAKLYCTVLKWFWLLRCEINIFVLPCWTEQLRVGWQIHLFPLAGYQKKVKQMLEWKRGAKVLNVWKHEVSCREAKQRWQHINPAHWERFPNDDIFLKVSKNVTVLQTVSTDLNQCFHDDLCVDVGGGRMTCSLKLIKMKCGDTLQSHYQQLPLSPTWVRPCQHDAQFIWLHIHTVCEQTCSLSEPELTEVTSVMFCEPL